MKMKKVLFAAMSAVLCASVCGCSSVPVEGKNDDGKEITAVLERMNKAYREKDVKAFMDQVSPSYQGDALDLKTAVENDFAVLVRVEYKTDAVTVEKTPDEGIVAARVPYSRQAASVRDGIFNKTGTALLKFKPESDGTLKLMRMPVPALYGLIIP